MRACEGCRRRKIKCDAATTNSWPCAACTRLKLNCVPPTVSYEKDPSQPGVHTFELERPNEYPTVPVGTMSDYQRPQVAPHSGFHHMQSSVHPHVPSQTYEPLPTYSSSAYMAPATTHETHYGTSPVTAISTHPLSAYSAYTSHPMSAHPMSTHARQDGGYHNPVLQRANSLDSSWNRQPVDLQALRQNSLDSNAWKSDTAVSPSAEALAEAMGGLKIDHLAIGRQKARSCDLRLTET